MKKLLLSLLVVSATLASLSSCQDSSKIPAPDVTSVPLIFAKASPDPSKNSFDFLRARASINELPSLANPTRPVFEFTIDIPDQRDVKIREVEVYKSFLRGTRLGPRAFVGAYNTFPATVSLNSQTALTGLQQLVFTSNASLPSLSSLVGATPTARNPIFNGDIIVFTFEYVLQDGSRVILTPLTDVRLDDGSVAKVISGTQINPPYALYAKFQAL
ncbi:hypothetical protein [Hymenobacter sp. B1770]|uniref:hypothetical protein n=1 Tax=Hymenobacter sp. B1770 TaxID=1718788 RepID=UPI003CF284D4